MPISTPNPSKPIRIALLGAGRFGMRHLQAIQGIPEIEVACVADRDPERLDQAVRQFGVPRAVGDYRDAIELPGIDAVDICLPNPLHADATIRAAAARKHVFCEKPAAITVEDALAAARSCAEAGVVYQIGFCRRFDQGWLTVRELIRHGRIGRPVVWRHATGTAGAPQPWFFQADGGGGPFVDGAIHWYDFARYTFGEPVEVVASATTLQPDRTAPDTGTVSILFESGDRLQLMWSWGLPRGAVGDELHDVLGPAGAIRLRQSRIGVAPVTNGRLSHPNGRAGSHPPAHPEEDERPHGRVLLSLAGGREEEVEFPHNNMIRDELEGFARCVRQGAAPRAGAVDGVRALEIASAVLQSARTGRAVRLAEALSVVAGR